MSHQFTFELLGLDHNDEVKSQIIDASSQDEAEALSTLAVVNQVSRINCGDTLAQQVENEILADEILLFCSRNQHGFKV